MKYKPGQAYYKEFTTSQPSTGAAMNATGTPVATANKNGVDDAAFVLTVANIDAGRYKITGTVPAGYSDGDVVNVSVAATVDSIAAKAVVDAFLVVSSVESDIAANVAAVKGDTGGLRTDYTTARAGKLDNLDAAMSSRLAAATYVTPDNAGIASNGAGIGLILTEVQSHPTLPEIEATTVLAKEATVASRPTLGQIEASTILAKEASLSRILGLVLENHVEDDIVRDGGGNKLSSSIYCYDSAANASAHDKATGLIARYNATFTYSGSNMTLSKIVRA